MPRPRYELCYLPGAEADLSGILVYIASELGASEAAGRLLDKIEQAICRLKIFPYAHPLYPAGVDTAPLEFRALVADSYIVLYYVAEQTVTVARIVYGGRDIQAILRKMGKRSL